MTTITTSASDLREYEIALVGVSEEAHQQLLAILKGHDIEPFTASTPTHIRLAYAIQKHDSAFFSYVQFMSAPETVLLIEKSLKLQPTVLRSLLLTPAVKPPVRHVKPDRKPDSPVKPEVAAPQALTNEALEQTLEEILK